MRSRRLGGTGPDVSLELVEPQTGATATGDDTQPGEVLNPGQGITSAGGRFSFVYLSDGDLVLYGPAGALWASNTHGQPVGVTIPEADGNLVIYGPAGPWSGRATPAAIAALAWSPRTTAPWSSGEPTPPPPGTPAPFSREAIWHSGGAETRLVGHPGGCRQSGFHKRTDCVTVDHDLHGRACRLRNLAPHGLHPV